MRVVYNLIKSPLIYLMIGFLIIEVIIFFAIFFRFYYFLQNNEKYINKTLISQSDEIFNSINFLINSKLNSVNKDLLLFNQHANIKHEYILSKYESNCSIKSTKLTLGVENLNFTEIEEKGNRAEKIDYLLNSEFLKNIGLYKTNSVEDNLNNSYLCYLVSFLKSIYAKNIISGKHKEKLNYTLFINDLILFYPFQNINDSSLRNLPFFNSDISCKYSNYKFDCSSIPKYIPQEDNLTLYNSIIYMNLKLIQKNLYINSCLNTNIRIFNNDTLNNNNSQKFFCIASNLTNILDEIEYDSNYFTFNIIQYNKEEDRINLLYSSNNNFYKDISINEESDTNLFTSDEYGKYQLKSNSQENIADLFNLLYYEIEKNIKFEKSEQELIQEYEANINPIKEAIKNNELPENKTINITVKQTFVEYDFNNLGEIDYQSSLMEKDDFMYILRPLETNSVKIIKDINVIDRKVKKTIFYTLTIIQLTKPKRGLIYSIHNFVCFRMFFYSILIESFICIIYYIFLFFLMRCILNPFRVYKFSIEKLLSNDFKNQKEKEFNINQKSPEQINQNNILQNIGTFNYQSYNNNISNKEKDFNKNEEKEIKNIPQNNYKNNYIKSTSEVEYQYTNLEMKEIEKIISFLQKILLLKDKTTPYQAKADFYQSISSEISNKYQLDLFHCQLLICEYYIKDKRYSKAKEELENFQIRLEQCRADYISKDKFIEKKNAFLSTYSDSYINHYTNDESIINDKFINLEMITEHFHYLMGLTNYFLFLELKKEKKEILTQNNKNKGLRTKSINEAMFKNFTLNITINGVDLNYQLNKLTDQMDYHLEKAIKHFKASYKINNAFQINQIKIIIILIYLSKCNIEFSNKSIEESNKELKKAFLTLSNFNKYIIDITDTKPLLVNKKKLNINNSTILKNFGILISKVIKKCYIDSRVMLIVNGSLIQFILYQIGKMALKLHRIKSAYFCFVKLIQISFFKNENIHFKAIKWLRFILSKQVTKGKKASPIKFLQFMSKRKNNSYSSLIPIEEKEIFIKKSSIDYMKDYLKGLIEIFEKNKYKRREKKISKELLSTLERKIDYNKKYQVNNAPKRSRFYSRNNIFSIIQGNLSSLNKDLNQSNESSKLYGDNSLSSSQNKNDKNSPSPSPKNNNQNQNISEIISRTDYEAITKNFIAKDLLIDQIIHSPVKIRQEEKIIKNIEKQYYRLDSKKRSNKCLIIILSEIFLDNFSSLKSFNLFLQYCIIKFLDEDDKIGYIYYSFSSGVPDKFYDLEYKETALKKLDELFKNSNTHNKNKKSLEQKKYLTDSFDIAMDMFINEQLNNDYDIDTKTDKYIFCFGTLNSLRYKCFEASFSQTNRINYMEISLYYFVLDSIENNKDKINHYKKYFKKFIEGFLIFAENFKLIKLCFNNICKKGKQKNLFSNQLECIKNII